MKLLKASLTSPTPLSDLILHKTTQMSSTPVASQPLTAKKESPNSRNFSLKVMIQKSTGKLLYAQAMEDFVEFLSSLLYIPLGGVEHLLAGKTGIKAINSLYRSTSNLIDSKHFMSPDTKKRLMKPNLPHGCISENYIFPLTEECLPAYYAKRSLSSVKFPNGKGRFLKGSPTYHVADDLTVTSSSITSEISSLREKKVLISDVKEMELQIGLKEVNVSSQIMELQIGLKEGLSILKASLTSTSALTDALLTLTQTSNKRVKREV